MRAWVYIIIAAILQTLWGVVLKILDFGKAWSYIKTGNFLNLNVWIQLLPLISYFILGLLIAIVISRAYKLLTMSVVYASWMGLSLALQVIVDVNFFGERMQVIQYVCIFLVLAGILGMKLSNPKKIINPIIDDSLD